MALRTLSVVDYILLILLLLSSAVIGAIFGFCKSKKSSAKEFLLGTNILVDLLRTFEFLLMFFFQIF